MTPHILTRSLDRAATMLAYANERGLVPRAYELLARVEP